MNVEHKFFSLMFDNQNFLGPTLVASGGAVHEIKNIKDSKVPVNALYSTPFRDDTEVGQAHTVYAILKCCYFYCYSQYFVLLKAFKCTLYTRFLCLLE